MVCKWHLGHLCHFFSFLSRHTNKPDVSLGLVKTSTLYLCYFNHLSLVTLTADFHLPFLCPSLHNDTWLSNFASPHLHQCDFVYRSLLPELHNLQWSGTWSQIFLFIYSTSLQPAMSALKPSFLKFTVHAVIKPSPNKII